MSNRWQNKAQSFSTTSLSDTYHVSPLESNWPSSTLNGCWRNVGLLSLPSLSDSFAIISFFEILDGLWNILAIHDRNLVLLQKCGDIFFGSLCDILVLYVGREQLFILLGHRIGS